MPEFIILPYDKPDDFVELSPQEIEAIIRKYVDWTDRLKTKGRLVEHSKLVDGEGRVLRGAGPKLDVTDGPFAETREIVGGFWIVEAPSYDEVVRWCHDCPHLEFGGTLSIRALER